MSQLGSGRESYIPLHSSQSVMVFFFFFFNDTATTEIYTLSLHDALPINVVGLIGATTNMPSGEAMKPGDVVQDRKSTRLNSSHLVISYAVFCLKKKKKKYKQTKEKKKKNNKKKNEQ